MTPGIVRLTAYIGHNVSSILGLYPICEWPPARSVEVDLPKPEIRYEFETHGVELLCDDIERVQAIFLRSDDGEALSGIDFSSTRERMVERYGQPSERGAASHDPILGSFGAWDLFKMPGLTIHIQYAADRDRVDMVTLMSPERAP